MNTFTSLSQKLKDDTNGSHLESLINLLQERESHLKKDIDAGLKPQEFKAKQKLLQACKDAQIVLNRFWNQLQHA